MAQTSRYLIFKSKRDMEESERVTLNSSLNMQTRNIHDLILLIFSRQKIILIRDNCEPALPLLITPLPTTSPMNNTTPLRSSTLHTAFFGSHKKTKSFP